MNSSISSISGIFLYFMEDDLISQSMRTVWNMSLTFDMGSRLARFTEELNHRESLTFTSLVRCLYLCFSSRRGGDGGRKPARKTKTGHKAFCISQPTAGMSSAPQKDFEPAQTVPLESRRNPREWDSGILDGHFHTHSHLLAEWPSVTLVLLSEYYLYVSGGYIQHQKVSIPVTKY